MPSESEYLRQQSDDAKAAIGNTISALKADLAKAADPHLWMKTHPWWTLASAAVAGFVAGTITLPGHTKRTANGEKHPSAPSSSGGMWTMLIMELIGTLKPIFVAALTERLKPQDAEKPAEAPSPTTSSPPS